MFLLYLAGLFSCHDIYIDQANGSDTDACWRDGRSAPCQTIMYALRVIDDSFNKNITFNIQVGNYTLRNDAQLLLLQDVSNISIIGASEFKVIITCEKNAGLDFISSFNIILKSFILNGCGKLHNITMAIPTHSYYNTSSYRSGLQFRHCSNIHLSKVTIVGSLGIGLDIIDTNGDNIIDGSWFINNAVPQEDVKVYPGGGGAAIRLQKDAEGVPIQYSKYTIRNCFFAFNNATSGLDMYEHRTINITTGRYTDFIQGNGGGLGIFLQSNASHNYIVIDNSHSSSNLARFGAGMMIKFAGSTRNNTVMVNSSRFNDNKGFGETMSPPGNEGGGVRVDFIQDVDVDEQNKAIFYNASFINNKAYKGGGLSIAFSEVQSTSDEQSLMLLSCYFTQNTAQAGSAVFASSFTESKLGFLQKVHIVKSTFLNNEVEHWNSVSGFGCVYTDKVPMSFSGDNTFSFNSGSALFVSGIEVEIASSSRLSFKSNTGHSGGAIALVNKGILTVNKKSMLEFVNNSAEIQGGAIFSFQSGFQETAYSEFCFIRYKYRFIHPKHWDCIFTFINNTAEGKDNSIAAPSILPCVWPESSNSSLMEDINATFCWENWLYDGSNCSTQIETFAAYRHPPTRQTIPFHVYPGRSVRIPLTFYDDRNVEMTSVLTAQMTGNHVFVNRYISNGNITLYGKPTDHAHLILSTLAPRSIKIVLNVTFRLCPPGFEEAYSKELDSYKCVCSRNYKETVYCSQEEFRASIQLGYLMTYNNITKETVVAPWLMYYGFHFDPKLPGYIELTNDTLSLNDDSCSHLQRTGFMCERCLPNKSVPMYGYSFECVDCSDKNVAVNWLYYILIELTPVTVFFLVIIAFNISITSGPTNGYILFAQIISNPVTVARTTNQLRTLIGNKYVIDVLKAIMILPYSIWNLDFISVLIPPFCVTNSPGFKAIHAYVLTYFTALYPLLLIIVAYVCIELYDRNYRIVKITWKPFGWCFSKIRRQWEFQNSVVDAFAGFLLLSYSKLCLVSFYLLVPVYVIDSEGKEDTRHARLFFDRSVIYFGSEHRPFFFLAIFVIVFFILLPPLFLFVYPLRIFQQLLNKIRFTGTAVRMFVESFQGCYNDGLYFGSRDCRWFASLYFVVRIIAFGTIVMSSNILVQRLVEMVVLIFMSTLFYIFRPYKDDYNNKVDTCMFGCLLLAVSVGMYSAAVPKSNIMANLILVVAILIPLLYMIGYTSKRVWKQLRHYYKSLPIEYQPRIHPAALAQSGKFTNTDLFSSTSSFPDRIINPKDYFDERSTFTRSEVNISYGATH